MATAIRHVAEQQVAPELVESSHERKLDTAKRYGALVLSSSLLTDRMLLHSGFIDALDDCVEVEVWATSAKKQEFYEIWKESRAKIVAFPRVFPFKEFPHNYLR